jgi:hypothetical protein
VEMEGGGAEVRYKVVGKAKVRKGKAKDSPDTKKTLEEGDEIVALETATLGDGTVRVRYCTCARAAAAAHAAV